MEKFYNVSSSPHVRSKTSTQNLMLDVIIAMIPTSIWGIYHFGVNSLVILVATVAACVLTELVYQKAMHKPVTIADLSAVVTGMILALNMPPQVPVWIPVFGGVFAILVVKQLYGGLGQNFMNPALAARCFLLISFATYMNNFSFSNGSASFDSVSGATPLASLRAIHKGAEAASVYSLQDLFIGNIPGTIGEVSAAALLIGGIYLIVRKVISWRIPVCYIGTFAVLTFLFGGFNAEYVISEVCAGGLIFGAFFMATDYVTSPITEKGQYVFGVVLGLFTCIFRLKGASPEGVSYAIILSNLLVPLIERITMPVAFGIEKVKKEEKKA
ncbi:RnfABCDGE type electron transport complex subunit D [[Clostridium] aminophilum]|uniref:RnfABCDGE type electron transport complex subunit D n=1 Tax=[Clostridium] aminophilum TaxID=1526 RepID=UPI003334371E